MPVQSMAEGTPDNSDTLQSGSDPLANLDLFQMITPLIMVIALIFALAWLVKKLNPNLPKIGKDIQVISTTPLSNHSKLCLIRAGGQDILIGVTNTNISHIQTFNEPVSPPVESEDPAEFSQQFKKLLKR
ncbi:flagellar biosynthetic protein FliO [Endozoicomonas sp. (ex Bugula neritina AB1)]|nr:flagellar biosynthetic protein FliO [Endozoicomonas sp. (ex Bugula neritina AB1)]